METAAKAIAIDDARRNFIDPPSKVNFVDVICVMGESSEQGNYTLCHLARLLSIEKFPAQSCVNPRELSRAPRKLRLLRTA